MAITIFIWFPILFVRGNTAASDRRSGSHRITLSITPNQMPCQTALRSQISRIDVHPALPNGKLSVFCADWPNEMAYFSSLSLYAPS